MLKRIKFTSVPVQDQSRALEFYTKKLGLQVFTDQPMGDSRWIELRVNGAETMLVLLNQPGHEPGQIPGVVFVADNVRRPTINSRQRESSSLSRRKRQHGESTQS